MLAAHKAIFAVAAGNVDFAVLNFDIEIFIISLGEFAFGALDSDQTVFNFNIDTTGYIDGNSANSRHYSILPDYQT